MELNFPLVILFLLPLCVYTKPTAREKESYVVDRKRALNSLKRENYPFDDTSNVDPYENWGNFDPYDEYALPDDTYWGGDEWMEFEEDGLGHGYDIIDNMTLGWDDMPVDLFASFEVFDGDEIDQPFIDFENLPVQLAQNKDHHRGKYPQFVRRNFDEKGILWEKTVYYDIDRTKISTKSYDSGIVGQISYNDIKGKIGKEEVELDKVDSIEQGIKDINELTCLNLVKHKNGPTPSSILRFTDDGGGCWSYVGKTGYAVQEIGLSDGCYDKSTVIHEIMHAIGMQHEHQRTDRDKYIKMLWKNIQEGKNNVNMMLEKTKDTNPFDIESVLQYGLYSFSNNGERTMKSRDKELDFLPDTATGLTFYDVMDITSGYQCTKGCKTKPNCMHGGFVGHHCKCMCPSGTKGSICQIIDSDCGSIISLKSGESKIITSPNYPNTYDVDKECVWLIKTLDGSKIHLNFEELQLPRNAGNNRCHHWLEIRYNLIGQTGPKRCGSITSTSPHASVMSNGDLMMLKLNSRFAKDKAPEKGFKVKVTAKGQGTDQGNPCDKSPCKNGGTCVNTGLDSFTCTCTPGWKGKTCTEQPCDSLPCQNGGTCTNNGNSFTCACRTGWSGATCSVQPCDSSPCQNGGTCSNNGNSFTCACTTGWSGATCTAASSSTSICTFEPSTSCFLNSDYTAVDNSVPAPAPNRGSYYVSLPDQYNILEVVLSINKSASGLAQGQQYCLGYNYTISSSTEDVEIGIALETDTDLYNPMQYWYANTAWTRATYTFTAANDNPAVYIYLYGEYIGDYGAVDDVTLASGSC